MSARRDHRLRQCFLTGRGFFLVFAWSGVFCG